MKNQDAINRMKTVEGHVGGIRRMLEEEKYCIDVIKQIQAVKAALNKASKVILEEHMNTCVISAIQGDDQAERERVLQEITEIFETANKV